MKLIEDLINGKGGICDSLRYCCVSHTNQAVNVIKSRFPSAHTTQHFRECDGGAVMDVIVEYDDFTIGLRFHMEKRSCGLYIKSIVQI